MLRRFNYIWFGGDNMNQRWDDKSFGAMPPKIDLRDHKLQPSMLAEYPDDFSLPIPNIKDQGSISSCVAHALSYTLENYNPRHNFSTGYIYGNRTEDMWQGKGMYLREALKRLQKDGDCSFEQFPYNIEVPDAIDKVKNMPYNIKHIAKSFRIDEYFKLETESSIKNNLMNYGYVIIAVKWYKDIELFGKVIKSYKKGDYGNHALTIFGWNNDGWLIANSWGTDFGDSGTAILPYDYPIDEAWGVKYQDDSNNTKVPIKTPIWDFVLKIISSIINKIRNIIGE